MVAAGRVEFVSISNTVAGRHFGPTLLIENDILSKQYKLRHRHNNFGEYCIPQFLNIQPLSIAKSQSTSRSHGPRLSDHFYCRKQRDKIKECFLTFYVLTRRSSDYQNVNWVSMRVYVNAGHSASPGDGIMYIVYS